LGLEFKGQGASSPLCALPVRFRFVVEKEGAR
jgi:hypothetical protein